MENFDFHKHQGSYFLIIYVPLRNQEQGSYKIMIIIIIIINKNKDEKKANPVHIIYCHVDRKPVYVTECHVDRKKNLVADRVATSLINCTHSGACLASGVLDGPIVNHYWSS